MTTDYKFWVCTVIVLFAVIWVVNWDWKEGDDNDGGY